jgi:ribose transport system ATP-binding protein
MNEMTYGLQQQLGEAALTFRPEQLVRTLSMGQKQLVEIMKAISTKVKIIAFDEPTSSLSDEETLEMFKLIRELTKQGISIIYVSHRLAEIFEICDRVTVFKDGKYVDTKTTREVDTSELIAMMVGRDLQLYEKTPRDEGDEIVFEVSGLKSGSKVKDISFNLKKGEILGMFGIVGSGRTETARAIFGLEEKEAGEIKVNGKTVQIKHPKDAVDARIGLVTEDRRGEGLALVMSVAENITMPYFKKFARRGIINLNKEKQTAGQMVDLLSIKTPKLETKVESLSGGNQQKIVISKWLGADSEILIFDEPTRGIDVGAKAEVHKLMDKLTHEGKSIVMISSELPEIMAMSDRILVFRDGMICAELTDPRALSEKDVLQYAIKAS